MQGGKATELKNNLKIYVCILYIFENFFCFFNHQPTSYTSRDEKGVTFSMNAIQSRKQNVHITVYSCCCL